MGRTTTNRDLRYRNDTKHKADLRNPNYGGRNKGGDLIFTNGGLPIDRDKSSNDKYIGKFLETICSIYYMYFTSLGRTMRKKTKEMNRSEKENQLEEDVKVEVEENA